MLTRPDGVRIAWEAHGHAEAAPVLLCTMATAAMSVWSTVTTMLGDRWRLILHDRRGEGESDPGAPDTHTFETFRDDALAVLQAARADRAVVCGMAFGARVALRIALDAPDRVQALVLFDATGAPPAPEADRTSGRASAARLRIAAGLSDRPLDPAWFRRRDPAGRGLNAAALRGAPPWIEGLDRISAPTLVACGEQDPNLSGARRLASEIPDARFVSMPMAGHASILDRPDLVVAHLRSFLGALSDR